MGAQTRFQFSRNIFGLKHNPDVNIYQAHAEEGLLSLSCVSVLGQLWLCPQIETQLRKINTMKCPVTGNNCSLLH